MAITQACMIEIVAKETGLTRTRASRAVEELLAIIKQTLASGENALITGFGKFSIRKKRKRLGRNPATREAMMLRS
jgi:integration host factor subunit alpha